MMLCRDVRQDINNRIRKESIMRKIISLLLTASLAAALLTGCGSSGTAQPAAKKTMVIGDTTFNSENWEETVDPHRTYNGWACIRYGIGETLVHYTDAMELEPWLATDWSNDGGCTWTITLRDGVKFSSGRDMDGEAVKQCLNHLLENHDRAPSDTKIVDVAADGQVLTVTTSEPNPALMNYLGDPYGCIIDVDASDFENGIVAGTGPYVVKELVTDDHLTLTPNTRYWNGTPKLDELTIRTLSNGDTLSAALQAGDIDAAYGMAYEAYPNFENGGYQFSAIQTSRAFFGSMNMTSPIIQDTAVRRAIAMGINKEGFVKTLLDGHGVAANGAFPDRKRLLKVPKLGPKAFEQCAGFLRVHGSNPLDATAVHPESYAAAKVLMERLGYTPQALKRGGIVGIAAKAEEVGVAKLAQELEIGEMTLRDILSELEKPGRDPRDELPAPVLRTDVLSMEDLKPGMELTGTVRNVIDFGAFVDIGVHQDGLVHISEMSEKFIKHPLEAVSVGDIVDVRVLGVDMKKKRISLSMKGISK